MVDQNPRVTQLIEIYSGISVTEVPSQTVYDLSSRDLSSSPFNNNVILSQSQGIYLDPQEDLVDIVSNDPALLIKSLEIKSLGNSD